MRPLAILLLSVFSAATAPASAGERATTRQPGLIRSVVVDAPAPAPALLRALGAFQGKPFSPAIRRAVHHAAALSAAELGWRAVVIDVPAVLSAQGALHVRVQHQPAPTPATPRPPITMTQIPLADWLEDSSSDVLVVRSERRLYAKLGVDDAGRPSVRQFPVALGRRSAPTPTGVYRIQAIAENPTWYPTQRMRTAAERRGQPLPKAVPPGPDNPLGRWFVALGQSIGIHGNNSPWSIGRYVSSGCIRMHNQDIEWLAGRVKKDRGVWVVDRLLPVPAAQPLEVANDRRNAAPDPLGDTSIRALVSVSPSPFHP